MRYLLGISLVDFRCFAGRQILFFEDLTILAGPNNSGKSAALNAFRRLVSVDLNRHAPKAHPAGAAFLGPDTYFSVDPADRRDRAEATLLELWIGSDVSARISANDVALPIDVIAEFASGIAKSVRVLDGGSYQTQFRHGDNPIEPYAAAALQQLPKLPIVIIPEHRGSVGSPSTSSNWIREERIEPSSLPQQLLTWYCEDATRFREWQTAVSDILGAKVVVELTPSRASPLSAAVDGSPSRPLDQLGAGITEVMNASRALVQFGGGLLLYEEPELHLHPRLQRRLMSRLDECSSTGMWQTIITTHSNHVLDFESRSSASIYVVVRSGDATQLVDASATRSLVMESLGARPSSLLQANAVVWVEGPSDAIYLRHFLACAGARVGCAPVEYVEFAFAFFGGALLHHTSAAVAPVPELVHLLSVHPNSFVIVDSDRLSEESVLGKDYTARFLETAAPERVWVTSGREMENYLADPVLMWAATDSVDTAPHQQAIAQIDRGYAVFADQVRDLRLRLGRQRAAHDASETNKTHFSRNAVDMMRSHPDIDWLQPFDLAQRLQQLLTFLARCRGVG